MYAILIALILFSTANISQTKPMQKNEWEGLSVPQLEDTIEVMKREVKLKQDIIKQHYKAN